MITSLSSTPALSRGWRSMGMLLSGPRRGALLPLMAGLHSLLPLILPPLAVAVAVAPLFSLPMSPPASPSPPRA